MKRFKFSYLFAFCLLLMMWAAPSSAFNLMISPSGEPIEPPPFDSPQPDTIKYDDGGYYYLYGPTNLWGIVRFTAPSDFEVRCIYIQMLNPNSVSDGVNVGIYNDNGAGQPGTLVSGPYYYPGPLWLGYVWLDVELDEPFPTFSAGENFFVIFGPAPTGTQTQGWFLYVDSNGNTENRSGYGNSQSGPWSFDLPGDLIVRAGGEVASYTDLSAVSCFNNTQKFFMDSGEEVTYRAEIANVGTDDVSSYRVIWRVYNNLGVQVFADSADYGALSSGATATHDCPTPWTTGAPGYYEATATVWNADDPLVENNTTGLEQGIGPLGFDWLKYDDGESNTSVSSSAGNGWGNRFDPPSYPVKVDSIQIWISDAIPSSQVEIVNFIGASVVPLGSYTGPLAANANTIDVTAQDINVFEGGIGVSYMYQSPGSIYKDDNMPCAAANSNMLPTAYQVAGGSWSPFESGDWMIRVYCSESSAVPPYPVIRLNPEAVDFGETTVGDPVIEYFWVCNDGGEDLIVTNILISSGLEDEIVVGSTSFTVTTLDSQEVEVTWTPNEEGDMSGNLLIMNNDTSPYPEFLPISGTATAVGVQPVQGSQPIAYAFEGNYPNPFNASTQFTFSLPEAGNVSLKIYDIRGQEVATLTDGWLAQGSYNVTYDASALSSGVYIYRLVANEFKASGKMVLLK